MDRVLFGLVDLMNRENPKVPGNSTPKTLMDQRACLAVYDIRIVDGIMGIYEICVTEEKE